MNTYWPVLPSTCDRVCVSWSGVKLRKSHTAVEPPVADRGRDRARVAHVGGDELDPVRHRS